MTEDLKSQESTYPHRTHFWGGVWLATGAFGVVITSVLYALAPPLAVLPIANVSVPEALLASVAGQPWMAAAGGIGIFADVALATGALVLLSARRPTSTGLETSGWAWLAVTNLIFLVVDALVAHVLGPVAALGGSLPAFTGFKQLFDLLFILGTMTFGIGSMSILWGEMQATSPVVPRAVSVLGILVGVVGVVSAVGYFLGVNLAPVIGGSIGVGAVLFTILGIQIARTTR
jgi:hypothetical protein